MAAKRRTSAFDAGVDQGEADLSPKAAALARPIADELVAARRLRSQEGPSQHALIACCSTNPPRNLSAEYDVLISNPIAVRSAIDLLDLAASRRPA